MVALRRDNGLRKPWNVSLFAYLDKLSHLSPLLLDLCAILLLHHAQSRYRQLELYFELGLPLISFLVPLLIPGCRAGLRLTKPRAPSCMIYL